MRNLEQPGVAKAEAARARGDDMVVDADAEQLRKLVDAPGRDDVGPAWRRVAARMVVRQDQRAAPHPQRVGGELAQDDLDTVGPPRALLGDTKRPASTIDM